MKSHFIVWRHACGSPEYLYSRRATKVIHESRSCWGRDIGQARVFTTKGAAKTAGSYADPHNQYKFVQPITFTLMPSAEKFT